MPACASRSNVSVLRECLFLKINFVFKDNLCSLIGTFAPGIYANYFGFSQNSILKFRKKCPTSRQWRHRRRRPSLTRRRLRTARTALPYRSHLRRASWHTGVSLSPWPGGCVLCIHSLVTGALGFKLRTHFAAAST